MNLIALLSEVHDDEINKGTLHRYLSMHTEEFLQVRLFYLTSMVYLDRPKELALLLLARSWLALIEPIQLEGFLERSLIEGGRPYGRPSLLRPQL